jgi:hypothetical protein
VYGNCFKAHHVNYYLWGQLSRMCNEPWPKALSEVAAHRVIASTIGDPDPDSLKDQIEGRQLWAILGWHGQFQPNTNAQIKKNVAQQLQCSKCAQYYKGKLTAKMSGSKDANGIEVDCAGAEADEDLKTDDQVKDWDTINPISR